ncbi:MAG: hypothetical protein Q8S03_18060 [Brevundimonas sp.]|uniref:hypothetical protein n=1 Tax=Brevundimonas sp. TaxID=1871086 RepID=UPI00273269A0|nr:hypothetical protein [Brevundimonas sp.]MDP3406599.1 hypothetical protein [Brevundimonas sp.]
MIVDTYPRLISAALGLAGGPDLQVVSAASGVDLAALELATETGENRFTAHEREALRLYFVDQGIFIVHTKVVAAVFEFPAALRVAQECAFGMVAGLLAAGVSDVDGHLRGAGLSAREPDSPAGSAL